MLFGDGPWTKHELDPRLARIRSLALPAVLVLTLRSMAIAAAYLFHRLGR